MNDLHKAIFHHDWTSAKERAEYMTALWKRISQWLSKEGRRAHYLNHYVNVDDAQGTSELVVVMKDRNAALMMKLALG